MNIPRNTGRDSPYGCQYSRFHRLWRMIYSFSQISVANQNQQKNKTESKTYPPHYLIRYKIYAPTNIKKGMANLIALITCPKNLCLTFLSHFNKLVHLQAVVGKVDNL